MMNQILNIELVSVYGIFGAIASTLSGSFFIESIRTFLRTLKNSFENLPKCPKFGIAYKQRVIGSNPLAPTKEAAFIVALLF